MREILIRGKVFNNKGYLAPRRKPNHELFCLINLLIDGLIYSLENWVQKIIVRKGYETICFTKS